MSRRPHRRHAHARPAAPLAAPLRASRQQLRVAGVQIARPSRTGPPDSVLVVEVRSELVTDPVEAQVVLTAIELACGTPAVLLAYEACGCRELYGRREHIHAIDQLDIGQLEWAVAEVDFARPAITRVSRADPTTN